MSAYIIVMCHVITGDHADTYFNDYYAQFYADDNDLRINARDEFEKFVDENFEDMLEHIEEHPMPWTFIYVKVLDHAGAGVFRYTVHDLHLVINRLREE